MRDDPGNIQLPDEVTVPLAVISELFGAVEQALRALDGHVGREDPVYRRLDDALAEVSLEIVRRLGLLGGEE